MGWAGVAGDVGKVKLNSCPDGEECALGWVWPCEDGGCGEGVVR